MRATRNGEHPAGHFARRTVVAWIVFLALVFLIVTLPDHPDAVTLAAFLRLPVEVPVIALLVLMLRGQAAAMALRVIITVVLGVILFLKLADLGTQSAFQRPFNPYLDGKMLVDGWNLLSGALGTAIAALGIVLILLTFCAFVVLLYGSLRVAAGTPSPAREWIRSSAAGVSVGLMVVLAMPLRLPFVVEAGALPYLQARTTLIATSISDMADFERTLSKQAPTPAAPNFAKVAGRDVILIFVESYGRSAVEDARYAPIIAPRLSQIEQQLAAKGFSSASRWITSPTVAGLSWLAHGTFLSGLWVDNQARYDRLMMSDWPTLNRQFAAAGWQSVAVMPAITMDWPEAAYYGYDRVLAAKDLGYRGKPYNWVTMPDQYTLSALQRLVRDRPDRKPVMAEIALISSHAPWTPVASLVEWAAVGDGTIFDTQADRGPTPKEVWADPERVRQHYIRTIDYSLETIGSYIATYGDDALFIVIGDHQPAAIVTGPDASRAVPMHVITRDAALLADFTAKGFTEGLHPRANGDLAMSAVKELLIETLSKP